MSAQIRRAWFPFVLRSKASCPVQTPGLPRSIAGTCGHPFIALSSPEWCPRWARMFLKIFRVAFRRNSVRRRADETQRPRGVGLHGLVGRRVAVVAANGLRYVVGVVADGDLRHMAAPGPRLVCPFQLLLSRGGLLERTRAGSASGFRAVEGSRERDCLSRSLFRMVGRCLRGREMGMAARAAEGADRFASRGVSGGGAVQTGRRGGGARTGARCGADVREEGGGRNPPACSRSAASNVRPLAQASQ